MPLIPNSHLKRRTSSAAVRFFAALSLFLLVGLHAVPSEAQRRRQRTPQPSTQGTGANSAATASKTEKSKRVFVGRTNETGKGSRQTIKSDNPLNDYSAYRSGDRFFVVLPKADANSIPTNDSGRGFSDMKVQQRGNDVVLSYRVQPGAKPRVEQKFNRLDVVFDAQEGGGAAPADAGRQAAATPHAAANPTRTQNNAAGSAAQNTPLTPAQNVDIAGRRQAANLERANQPGVVAPLEASPAQGSEASPQFTSPLPSDVATQSPIAPAATPAGETEVAMAQPPPTTAAPITTIPDAATPNTQIGTSLGTVLLRNWPVALTLALLLVGVGLFMAARRSSATTRPPIEEVVERKLAEPSAVKGASQAKLKEASTHATLTETPGGVAGAATPAVAASLLGVAAACEDEKPVEKIVIEEKHEAVELPSAEETIDTKHDDAKAITDDAPSIADAAATTEDTPVAVANSEQVQIETQRLLDGEAYNRNALTTADVMTRQIVAAELLSALSGRNAERRDRARKAFIEHGYFNETAHDLHFAAAPAERSAAARSLGHVNDRAATSHLVAALEDPTVEVRRAAVESLSSLRDPKAVAPLEALFEREQHSKNKVARKLVLRAIEACRGGTVEEEQAVAAAPSETVEAVPATDLEATAETPQTKDIAPIAVMEPAALITEDTAAEESSLPVSEEKTGKETRDEVAAALIATEAATILYEEEATIASPVFTKESPAAVDVSDDETETLVTSPVSPVAETRIDEAPAVEEVRLVEEAMPVAEEAAAAVEETAVAGDETPVAETEPSAFELREDESASALPVAYEDEAATLGAAFTSTESEPAPFFEETSAAPTGVAESPVAGEANLSIEHFESSFVLEDAGAATPLSEAYPVESALEAEHQGAREIQEALPVETAHDVPTVEEVKGIEPVQEVKEIELVREPEAEPVQSGKEIELVRSEEDWIELDMDEMATVSSPNSIEPSAPTVQASHGDALFTNSAATPTPEPSLTHAVPMHAPGMRDEREASEGRPDEGARAGGERGVEVFDELSTVPKAIQQRLSSEEPSERVTAIEDLSRLDSGDAFQQICAGFDDEAKEVRGAAARALYEYKADRAESFTRALREATPERRRNIGAAISISGLAGEAVGQLTGESRDKTYEAFSLLFLMAKAGEVQPLIRAIEGHPDNEVRLAVVKLLALSGQKEILPAFRRLAVRGSLPTEVRSAVMEAIYQISSGQTDASSAA